MWLLLACLSALFAGLTSVLAKCGIRETDSNVATAIRTTVVLLVSWGMVLLVGSGGTVTSLDGRTVLFLVLSGLATGASWLCYYRALQLGNVNEVVPVDKLSTVLALLLAFVFLKEGITWLHAVATLLIAVGTLLMVRRDPTAERAQSRAWLPFAILSAVFAGLTPILAKIGIDGVESNLGTALRTGVVLLMAWGMVFVTGKQRTLRSITRRDLLFICLSGLATGASWLCYYRALQLGRASVVMSIDKLSILVTVAFSMLVLRERLSLRSGVGLTILLAGTVMMIF